MISSTTFATVALHRHGASPTRRHHHYLHFSTVPSIATPGASLSTSSSLFLRHADVSMNDRANDALFLPLRIFSSS
jgi:hypothetical protein